MSENILFHFLLFKFIPNIDTYDEYLEKKKRFIFDGAINNKDFINRHFVESFLHKKKMTCVKEILNNSFITDEKKENILHYFSITQNIYYKLKRFGKILINKKIKNYDMDFDLCFLPLSKYNNNFSLIQENTRYIFKINDLIRIILDGLTNTFELFIEPKESKNPYNNIEFKNCELYNIYFHILFKTNIHIPFLLHAFFKSEFNISKFIINNESYLKDLAIDKFIIEIKEDPEKQYEYILNMTEKTELLPISNAYPENDVIQKLGHLIPDYLFSEYSYNPTKRRQHQRILKKQIKEFKKNNPRYGRVYRRINREAINRSISTSTLSTIDRIIEDNINNSNSSNQIVNENDSIVESDDDTNDILVNSNNTEPRQLSNDFEEETTTVSINDTSISWTNNIHDIGSDERFTTTYRISYSNILDNNSNVNNLNPSIILNDVENNNENLITASEFIRNYRFNDETIPSINTSTFNDVVSTNAVNSEITNSNLEINDISNQPYDAYIGPFSPSSTGSSVSLPSNLPSPTINLNSLNNDNNEFNLGG